MRSDGVCEERHGRSVCSAPHLWPGQRRKELHRHLVETDRGRGLWKDYSGHFKLPEGWTGARLTINVSTVKRLQPNKRANCASIEGETKSL